MSKNIILDLELGNLKPIQNKLNKIGIEAEITNNLEKIKSSNFIIISGVGHFKAAMEKINSSPLFNLLNEKFEGNNTKILGICLGMQLFTKFSEEGGLNGLGWIDGKTIYIKDKNIKVPNINWLEIKINKNINFQNKIDKNDKFYFCHSYHCEIANSENIFSTSKINDFEFVSAIYKNKIFGTQFHLEKSHDQGLKLIKSFYEA